MRQMLIVAFVGVLLARPASATEIVYDNGAPNGDGWSVSQGYLLADDFMFPVDTTVMYVGDWGRNYWMILKGELLPTELVATGAVGTPILAADGTTLFPIDPVTVTGGTRYWLGMIGRPLTYPCGNSSGADLTDRNDTRSAVMLSYAVGPVGDGSDFCASGEAPPYDFSAPYWGPADGFPTEGVDFAFKVIGKPVPEPATWLLLGVGVTATLFRRRQRTHGLR